jgi:hypothetical protein
VDASDEIEGLISSAASLNGLVLFGATICGTVVVLRCLGKDQIEIKGIQVPMRHFWMAVIALTIAHLYLSWVHVEACKQVSTLDADKRLSAWTKLTMGKDSPLLFRSMKERNVTVEMKLPFVGKQRVHQVEKADNTLWLSLALVVVVFGSVLHFTSKAVIPKLIVVTGAVALALVNWLIGGHWAIATSSIKPSPVPITATVTARPATDEMRK